MIDKDSKCYVSLEENHGILLQSGVYSVAKVSYNRSKDEYIIDVPSRTIEEPKYSRPTRSLVLGSAFIESALTRPQKPSKKATQQEIEVFRSWNKLPVERKVEFSLLKLAHDLNCSLVGFEIL